MRFASRFLKYKHGVRKGREMVLATGDKQILVSDLFVAFKPGNQILTEDEIAFAMKAMVHHGLPLDRDTEEHFSPRSRISGYDTVQAQEENEWTDDERLLVEKTLLNSPHKGSDHIELKAEPAVIPWPTYDGDKLEQIVMIARATGLVEAALKYERENANRAKVIEALSEEPEAAEAPVVVDAS